MGKLTSVPASLRLAIFVGHFIKHFLIIQSLNLFINLINIFKCVRKICELAGWIAMAAAFHNNPNINFMTDNVALTCILIIRIIYLIVFVIGSVVSFLFLLVAFSDRTYGLALPVSYLL